MRREVSNREIDPWNDEYIRSQKLFGLHVMKNKKRKQEKKEKEERREKKNPEESSKVNG